MFGLTQNMPKIKQSNQTGDLRVIDWLWVGVLLLAPMDSVLMLPYSILGFRLSLFRISLMTMFAFSLINVLVTGRIRILNVSPTMYLYLAWIVWTAISGLWAPSENRYFRYMSLAVTYSALVIVVPMLAKSTIKYRTVLKYVSGIVILSVSLGVLEKFTGFRLTASRQWAFRNEVTSFFHNPSHFAAALVMFSPFIVHSFLNKRRLGSVKAIVLIIILILGFYMVMHTGSRGAVLSLVVVLASTVLLSSREGAQLVRLSAFLMVTLSALLLLIPVMPTIPLAIQDKLSSLTALGEFIAGSDRLVLMRNALRLWESSPLIGWGAGASELLLERIDPLGGVYSLHSWVLELLVNTGLVGLMLFALFYLLLLVQLVKAHRYNADAYVRYVAGCLFTGLVSAIPLSFVLGSLMTFPVFWLYIGLSLGLLRLHRRPPDWPAGSH